MSAFSAHSRDQASRAIALPPPDSIDGDDFDALFRACAADVHGYVLSLLGDRSSAEDVTALAFERLYRSRSRLDRTRGTPRAWLFAIARNAALDELRRRRRQPQLPAATVTAHDHATDAGIEHVERRAMVRAGLASLSAREREVVLLKFHGQLSNGELARVLGVSETNAGTRLHRALSRLRESCTQLANKEVA